MRWFEWLFPKREKVNLDVSLSEVLTIVPPSTNRYSSSNVLPGIYRSPNSGKTIGSRGIGYFTTNERAWVPPQYDHLEVEILYDIEGYFARATRAKSALFYKEGYTFIGKNELTVKYIQTRIQQIERASQIPFDILLLSTFRDIVVHSNCYWLKVRKPEASGGKTRIVDGRTIKPVAGYFRLPPETMVPELDRYGNITRWKQDIGGYEKIYKKEDIVHFYTNTKAGYPLGIPRLLPAIDDIRALRSIEHNIDVLIHKHIFPILLWQVGTENSPAKEYANGETEIEILKEKIAEMPTEGSLVIPERYDVKAVGVENKALKVEGYLQHFRERILADLDVSSIDVGIGNTSNRSTAGTLSRNLIDVVKMDQITIENFMQHVIEELLLESTFPTDTILQEQNLVHLKFKEIDKESKQAEANHLTDLFHKNAILWPELRLGIGLEVPSEQEEKDLYWNKFGREMALIQSVDEDSGKGVANNNRPENQHGTRPSAKLNKDSSSIKPNADENINPILKWHRITELSLQTLWEKKNADLNEAKIQISLAYSEAQSEFLRIVRNNINSIYPDPIESYNIFIICQHRTRSSIGKLQQDLIDRMSLGKSPTTVFKVLEYRTKLIYSSILGLSTNLSKFRWFRDNQINMTVTSSPNACNSCMSKLTVIRWNDKLGENKLPPFHSGCECGVKQYVGN
jgi:hypothetical protein